MKIEIDPETSVNYLIDQWVLGNRNLVIEKLSKDHAGLTALMLVEGSYDCRLDKSDCNAITNMLINQRQLMCN